MEHSAQFITPEAQSRRDRVINSPSWAGFAFNGFYLAWMRGWTQSLLVVFVLATGIWLSVSGGALKVVGAALAVGSWLYAGLAGKRIAWVSRTWRDLDDFVACQRVWDRWGKVVITLVLVTGALAGSGELEKREPRTGAIVPLICVLLLGLALRWNWRKLAPGSLKQSFIVRGLLIILWMTLYSAFIVWMSIALDKTIGRIVSEGPFLLVWFAGMIGFIARMMTWAKKGRRSEGTAVNVGPWKIPSLIQVTAEAFTLPFRQPLTLLPYLFAVGITYAIATALGWGVTTNPDLSEIDFRRFWKPFLLGFAISFPLYLFAGEVTSELVARHELGRPMKVHTSFLRAASRMPAGLLAATLQLLGVATGSVFLIVPGLILFVRWIFVPHAVLLARDNAIRAFRTSRQLTVGHGWRISGLLTVILLWSYVLQRALQQIPTVGPIVISWLDFSWITVATTVLYIRAGGPVRDKGAELTETQANPSPRISRSL